jgi:DNA-directed RNA polymerase specialized sigma24 family protein
VLDPVEQVALVAQAKRELLLRVYRYRLRREDLEDCYSQATLELIAQARTGRSYASSSHLRAAIERRFVSRILDRRRALSGRSPLQAALESSVPLAGLGGQTVEVVDQRAEIERLVMLRHDLRRLPLLARELSIEKRLVLASQVSLQMPPSEFCRRFGWTPEKYRKVAQRARARLSRRMSSDEPAVPAHAGRSGIEPGTNL